MIYKEEKVANVRELNGEFKVLDKIKAKELERAMIEKEVWEAIESCDENKAPRPDDFNLNFSKNSLESIRDCRPISFVGNIYKIITTVLANRMKKVIGEMIGNQQFAFMFGRQLVDCALIANEVVDIMRKDQVGGVFFKVD
ncbi:PREDICTED: uncharacterized protein LOC108661395 [Theobroma cacao]|uniref:Uncharacterized protein LOC108661395 n=1 Tax=Theobroma cacao TaxID=3641 RepID=A0AB32W5I8_THECC|nr:PREDICTED: uncharacterized protein LOC108661395 [Theobroma cacao]